MSETNETKAAAPTRTFKPQARKPGGRIVYNRNLDAWRCIDPNGRQVLSTGSKDAALRAYPTYTVIEKE